MSANQVYAGTLALLLGLGACGGNEAPPSNGAGAPVATTAPAVPAGPSSSIASAPADTQSADNSQPAVAAAQVSETSDGEEPDATPASAPPPLKLAAVPAPVASRFKEGVHYQRLSPTQPTSVSPGSIEVVEVFWYGCPHCFQIDSKLEAWREKSKPSYVVFERIPATWNEITRFHGRLFYAAAALGKLEDLHPLIFREIHANNNPLNTVDQAKSLFTSRSVSASDFQKAFGSSATDSKLQRADLLGRRYRVQSVPYFVINGKYTADVESAGGESELLALLTDLAAREHGE
ncbi:MAG: DsbA family protein [Candidatus Obscuribacterales bacterium]|nr:DsbA family protein [Steroidobacteraceae bacterium]